MNGYFCPYLYVFYMVNLLFLLLLPVPQPHPAHTLKRIFLSCPLAYKHIITLQSPGQYSPLQECLVLSPQAETAFLSFPTVYYHNYLSPSLDSVCWLEYFINTSFNLYSNSIKPYFL